MSDTFVPQVIQSAPKFVPGAAKRRVQTPDGIMEFELFKVVDEYHYMLKEKAIDWDFQDPPGDLQYIAVSMIQTMIQNGGVGLAANQCGLPYNIFVMGTGQFVEVVINPKIISKGEEFETSQEGCLSFPGVFLKVKRSTKVEVSYFDVNGQQKTLTYDGLTARIFLHEFDHLQGVRFVEYVSPTEFSHAKSKAKGNIKKIQRAREDASLRMAAETRRLKAEQAAKERNAAVLAAEAKARQVPADTVLRFDTPSVAVKTEA